MFVNILAQDDFFLFKQLRFFKQIHLTILKHYREKGKEEQNQMSSLSTRSHASVKWAKSVPSRGDKNKATSKLSVTIRKFKRGSLAGMLTWLVHLIIYNSETNLKFSSILYVCIALNLCVTAALSVAEAWMGHSMFVNVSEVGVSLRIIFYAG